MLIGQELDVAHFQDHVQGFAQARLFEDVGGIELRGREWGDFALVAEAREGADEVRVPSAAVLW